MIPEFLKHMRSVSKSQASLNLVPGGSEMSELKLSEETVQHLKNKTFEVFLERSSSNGNDEVSALFTMNYFLGAVEVVEKEPFAPVVDCRYQDKEDGCCSHPKNHTPECHIGACPRIDQRLYEVFRPFC
jgi:hypothetical protein